MFKKQTSNKYVADDTSPLPTGTLRKLRVSDIKRSQLNPRMLFDEDPFQDLLSSIRVHGVLVPITVFPLIGQDKFSILDGERRYRCCVILEKEGLDIEIPANIVEAPTKVAGLLYMFSIHNLREQWELMPTALSLKVIIDELDETDTQKLSSLTGLSSPQIERCKILLEFPEEFQNLSLEPDPQKRIPANFWIEANPVINLTLALLPDLQVSLGRDGVIRKLVEKYQKHNIKSVIHFRRIMEAYESSVNTEQLDEFTRTLKEYILNPDLETRAMFDSFSGDMKRIQNIIKTCDDFIIKLDKAKLNYTTEKEDLTKALEKVKIYIDDLLQKLAGGDAPNVVDNEDSENDKGN